MSSSYATSTTSAPDAERDAPAVELRASVLEAAIDLGFRNSVMKRWMFDPVAEGEDEETAEHNTPALTSPSTSEESAMSPYSIITPSQSTHNYPYPRQGNTDKRRFGSNDQFSTNVSMGGTHDQKAPPVKLTLAVPPTRNKLRKQRTPTGCESDGGGGYLSDVPKKAKVKNKKSMPWMRKTTEGDDGESDGGYRSEAISGARVGAGETKKKRRKTKNKEMSRAEQDTLPMPLGDRDAGALLATINASVLPDSGSGSGISHGMDGYLTDSGVAEKRGRTKKKARSREKEKTRAGSPLMGGEDSNSNTPTKKKSLFRLMARSASREGKVRNRETETPPPPPVPVPPLPLMPLPIAERFARAGTPTGNSSMNVTSTSTSSSLNPGLGPGLTKSSSSVELRSVESLSTLVPPSDVFRSESPWSNRSAPSRMGTASTEWAGSLDLLREKEEAGVSPLSEAVQPHEKGSSINASNGYRELPHSKLETDDKKERSASPTAITANGDTGPELGRSRTKRIAKLFPFGNSHNNDNGASPSSKFSISNPNPHLAQRESMGLPNPFEIAAALTATAKGFSPMDLLTHHKNANLDAMRSDSPDSFIMIEEDEGIPTPLRQQRFENTNLNNEPSSSYLPSSAYGRSDSPSSPTRPGLAARRRAPVDGLDVTPTQSRVGSPGPDPGGFRAARASVLAYYQVPPPSPPPVGPLPPRPEDENDAFNSRQLLSPGRAYASRSPSPLGTGARYSPARSSSPGMGMGQVRRGRESPFPARPILPPQDSRELVERVERYKALYAAIEGEGAEDAYASVDEYVDKHSSAYIRAARARGEKRVYFDVRRSYESSMHGNAIHANGINGAATPEIEIEPADDYNHDYNELDENADSDAAERLGVRDALETVMEEDSSDNRSFASTSVYSRYSMLDEGKSAVVRDGLVRRVAALYGQEQFLREVIPEVPKVPSEFRDAGFAAGRQPEKTASKIMSSPIKF